ncbi:thioredoxin family protein [Bacillus sp. JCM 19034]|uniref:thioredoxin family protein n=1 Tax=Bacillus sp. JCM 19034 TaxID=1481928 RepID=UPI0007801D2F|nr:thioredoxin family protein [Bacillus sp. JCM 19034]
MIEITVDEVNSRIKNREEVYLFIYTPLCGTCSLAKRMMDVVEEMLPSLQISSMNLNQAPDFAQTWEVKSVPALFIFQKGFRVKEMYAFHSIMYVHQLLKPYSLMEKGEI